MSQALAAPVNRAPTTKAMLTFNCKVCGREMLKVWGNPRLPERVKCPHCGSTYRVRTGSASRSYPKPHPQISRGAVIAIALVPAVGAAALGSFIFKQWPKKGDSPEVIEDKASKLVGTFTASGFMGLLTGLIAAPKLAKRW